MCCLNQLFNMYCLICVSISNCNFRIIFYRKQYRMQRPNYKNDDAIDLSDSQEQRKILMALVGDLEQNQQQQKTQIVYDPVLGISQLFKLPTKQQVLRENKQQKRHFNLIQKIKEFISSQKTTQAIFSIRSVLFNVLKVQQFDWLERNFNRYKQQQLGQVKEAYILRMKLILSRIRFQIQTEQVNKLVKGQTLGCVNRLQRMYEAIRGSKKWKFQLKLNWEKDYIFMMMISAFQVFEANYCPYKRTKLKKLFKQLQNESSFNNSIEVLRFLENKDPLLSKLRPIDQLELNRQVAFGVDQYLTNNQSKQIKTNIALIKVSNSFKRRRVINLLISGFLSEDVDKKQQWNQLLACMPDSQVYGLQWESNTINALVRFLALSIKDIILGKNLNQLLTKDNPFIPAFQVSIQAGEMLAYVVHKLFPFQFVNIISYSLGSELIRAFVQKTIELNRGVNLNKVITMGGVSDISQFQRTLQKTDNRINILNVKSKHDSVLKYILKRAKPGVKPMGLNDLAQNLNNHLVNNLDTTSRINGHFSYMTNFGTIAQLLMLNEE